MHYLSPLILSGIRVAFEIPERTELETVGDVEVCAVVVEGILAREAIVTVASRDGSALGTSLYSVLHLLFKKIHFQ